MENCVDFNHHGQRSWRLPRSDEVNTGKVEGADPFNAKPRGTPYNLGADSLPLKQILITSVVREGPPKTHSVSSPIVLRTLNSAQLSSKVSTLLSWRMAKRGPGRHTPWGAPAA